MRKLTTRQQKYCRERASGKDRIEAAIAAGYSAKGKRKTVQDNAYNLERNTAIRQRIEELQQRADTGCIMTRQQRMQLLSDFALDDAVKDQDRLRALDQLARMNSDYTDRVELSGSAALQLSYADRLEAIKASMEDGQQ